jgi:mRNA interferase RelE/StbE
MSWAVAVSNRARRNLKRVPAADQQRIMAALDDMGSDPLSGDVVKLAGQDAFRRRVGNYRIIFQIDFKALAVGVLDIQRRTTTTYR